FRTMDNLSKANCRFTLDLFRKLIEENEAGNIFFSPFSISTALAMVYLGARNNTASEMAKLEQTLTLEKLQEWTLPNQMWKPDVDVRLPKFKLEGEYDLIRPLSSLGMRDIFDHSRADLSGMSGDRDLSVSKVVHKSFVEVNEEGTEAAAATGTIAVTLCYTRPQSFTADHPFLFFIRHNKTNNILFFGRYTSP
ncbi:hypothetical protein scyTo_0023804, partial [Scyliorhinus torazame]|nr:hypothetical protein [Scyliorhinus torazame]